MLKPEDAAMQRPRTLTGWIGLGLLALSATVGCSGNTGPIATTEDSGRKRIVLLTNTGSPFWGAAQAGMQEADKDLALNKAGLEAVMVFENTPEDQVKRLSQFATRSDIAAVAISVTDAANAEIAGGMRALKEKKIPVITMDSDVDPDMWRGVRVAFIGTDNQAAGRVLGRCAKALRPEGGEYVAFLNRRGAQNNRERLRGFAEGAGPKFKVARVMGDDRDPEKARENVSMAIREHPNAHTLVGIRTPNGPAIADVVQELSRKKDFTVVAFDADPRALQGMREGLIDALVVQKPHQMGYQAVRLLKALIEKDKSTIKEMLPKQGEPDGDVYHTGVKVVVPDKDSPLKADLFDKQAEFLKLGPFSEWLEKRGLSGS